MSILSSLKKKINDGIKGLNKGLSTGLSGLDKNIYGTQRGWIYTVLGSSSSGKTSFALYAFVYGALKEKLEDDSLHILYYSLEQSAEILFAKLASLYIWDKFEVCISYSEMMSMTEILSNEKLKIVEKAYEWLEKVENRFIIYDKKLSADDLQNHLQEYFESKGKFIEKGDQIIFESNNPNAYHIAIIDHVKLLSYITPTVKPEIDKACKVLIYFRNTCNLTGILIQQANRGNQDIARKAADLTELQLSDAQDTSDTIQASDVVLAINFPMREKVATARDYKVNLLKDKLRTVMLLKNRYGAVELSIGVSFYGKIGYWRQMPIGKEMSDSDYNDFMHYMDEVDEPNQLDKINKLDKNDEEKIGKFNFLI